MYLGPIHSVLPGLTTGQNPVKDIKVTSSAGKQAVLFDQEYPYGLQSSPVEITSTLTIFEQTQALALVRLQQLKELFRNKEWERCGIPIVWREDGVSDPDDGWYSLVNVDVSDDYVFSGYGEPQIDVALRAISKTSLGMYVDAKAVPNDQNLPGTPLAAFPMGVVNLYPFATYTFSGANGSISVVENPISNMRFDLNSVTTLITKGRCKVADETVNGSTSTEVFYKDHRNINGYWRVSNDVVRYTLQESVGASPLIEIWDPVAGAWSTLGNYQIQTTNTGPVLPLQSVLFQTISPEEVIWTERRFDTAGTALVVMTNRMRRGSRLIESQIVTASGAGLTGTQSVAIVNAPNVTWALAQAADSSGAAFNAILLTDGFEVAGSTVNAFQSIGTSGDGTSNAWSMLSGAPTYTASTSWSLPANAWIAAGHMDWTDLVNDQTRFTWATGGTADVHLHQVDANNYIRLRADGTNFHIDKVVAGVVTNDLVAATPAALVNGTSYWIKASVTGQVWSVGIYADAAGAPGAQIGSTLTATVADNPSGRKGLRAVGATIVFGGAFANVCQTQIDGKGWNAGINAGEPAFCMSKVSPYAGTYSASIYIANAAANGFWSTASTHPAEVATAAGQLKLLTGSTGASHVFMSGIGNSSSPAADSAWHLISVTGTANLNAGVSLIYAGGVGTAYFDNVEAYTSNAVPGFTYLTLNPNTPTVSGQSLYSGSTVPAGTVTRIGILAGVADDQYIALLTAAAYSQRWAAYGRTRIRQRLLVG